MTGTRAANSKCKRAMELSDQGLSSDQIAIRLGTTPRVIATMLRNARRKREAEIERVGRLADIMGANV